MRKIKVFFDNKRGIRVTERAIKTRLKYMKLSHVVKADIGREPFYVSLVISTAWIAFLFQFERLLYAHEQMAILFVCTILVGAAYSVAALKLSTVFNDKTMVWYDFWTVRKVLAAIEAAEHFDVFGNKKST